MSETELRRKKIYDNILFISRRKGAKHPRECVRRWSHPAFFVPSRLPVKLICPHCVSRIDDVTVTRFTGFSVILDWPRCNENVGERPNCDHWNSNNHIHAHAHRYTIEDKEAGRLLTNIYKHGKREGDKAHFRHQPSLWPHCSYRGYCGFQIFHLNLQIWWIPDTMPFPASIFSPRPWDKL
jgi:hypothetical protein